MRHPGVDAFLPALQFGAQRSIRKQLDLVLDKNLYFVFNSGASAKAKSVVARAKGQYFPLT